jgi:large subunit ribosomal protein L5
MLSLKEKYLKEVIPEMKKQFGFKNDLQVPRIEKLVINVGIGGLLNDSALVKEATDSLSVIAGQKVVLTQSRKSIAGFKIRKGLKVGIKATLRGKRMWEFLEKLVGAAIPRIRDFQGIKKSAIDQGGNLNLGVKEHTVFPEILPEKVKKVISLQINIVTGAKNREEGLALFKYLKFPLKLN